ncbi:hypothetical protein C4K35_1995 [Pseudomonas chlororaphis subsp. piscium]|nr:hypothetical protein C4K35_1995 [Pseudomonas chlororaphis subsp. piscium]
MAVQPVDGLVIDHGQGQFAATAGDLGGRLDILPGPEAELEPRVEDEQSEGRRQLDRRPVQQAAVKVGAGGGAVDVKQKVGASSDHLDSWKGWAVHASLWGAAVSSCQESSGGNKEEAGYRLR